MSKRIAIITGATGGIGKEFVNLLLEEELDEIWSIARNQEKLEALRDEFGEKVIPIPLDIASTDALTKFNERLSLEKPDIHYLINNASLARMGASTDFSLDEIEATISLNCKAPVMLCNLCIPYMKKGSHILNISSASSFQPNPYINLYAATKVFERNYSRSLNVELKERGICVTAVCPSWVDTQMLTKEINGTPVQFPGMVKANAVARKAMHDAKRGKDMSVCSFYVKCQHLNVKLMPQRLTMHIWMKGLRKYL